MRVLLDENIPVQLKRDLTGHEVVSLKDVGWQGIDNGALLRRVEGRYDVLLTADKNIYSQQTLTGRSFSILVVPTNRRRILVGYVPSILDALTRIRAGELVVIGKDDKLG